VFRYKKLISICLVAILVLFISIVAIVQRYTVSFINRTSYNHVLFDFKASSSIGFTADDISQIESIDGIRLCEGSNSCDLAMTKENGRVFYMEINSITEGINTLEIVEGRLPENSNEIVVDSHAFYGEQVGEKLTVANLNEEYNRGLLSEETFTIVGTVISPVYIVNERGITDSGTEEINAFAYVMEDAFQSDIYSDVYIKMDEDHKFFDEDYSTMVSNFSDAISEEISQIIISRFQNEKMLEQAALEEKQKANERSESEADSLKNAGVIVDGRENKLSKATSNIEYLTAHKAEVEGLIASLKAEIASMDEAAKTDPAVKASSTYSYKVAQYQNALTEYNNLLTTLEVANREIEDYKLQLEASKAQYNSTNDESNDEQEKSESEEAQEEIPVVSLIDRMVIPGYSTATGEKGLFGNISFSFDNMDYIFSLK